jgi:hypothetical protein
LNYTDERSSHAQRVPREPSQESSTHVSTRIQ